jgi:hypothetical protein
MLKKFRKVVLVGFIGFNVFGLLLFLFIFWVTSNHAYNNVRESSALRHVSEIYQTDPRRQKILSLLPIGSTRPQVEAFIRDNFLDSSPTTSLDQLLPDPHAPHLSIAFYGDWTICSSDSGVIVFLFDVNSNLSGVLIKRDGAAL